MHHTRNDERGFTLIELLIVTLILAILAAIALPAYLQQKDKASDGSAKSDARNLVSQLEACWHNDDGYVGCTAELTATETGLPIGTGPGQVAIFDEQPNSYRIVAVSRATSGGSNHSFTIEHTIQGPYLHDCTVRGFAGCPADGDW